MQGCHLYQAPVSWKLTYNLYVLVNVLTITEFIEALFGRTLRETTYRILQQWKNLIKVHNNSITILNNVQKKGMQIAMAAPLK